MADQTVPDSIPVEALDSALAAARGALRTYATERGELALTPAQAAIRVLDVVAPILVAAGRAQAADAERERDEAHRALNATRQMSIDANTALRTQLLAALGVQDDGHTPLGDYVSALVADRDAAESRGRAQAAADIRADPYPNPSPAVPAWHAGYVEATERAARVAEGTTS